YPAVALVKESNTFSQIGPQLFPKGLFAAVLENEGKHAWAFPGKGKGAGLIFGSLGNVFGKRQGGNKDCVGAEGINVGI
ncbi:MAG TPA: hypothetical protein DDY25_03305, partial [Peptococcaceae bacterium]|nr:hypothetical protein [Peptococcaceae bacterium]